MLLILIILLLAPCNLFAWERDGKAWSTVQKVKAAAPVILSSNTLNTWVVQNETGITILETYYRDKKTSAEVHYKDIDATVSKALMPYIGGYMELATGEIWKTREQYQSTRYIRIAKEKLLSIDEYVNELEMVIETLKAK